MNTKKEDLESSKRLYADYLKGREKPKNESGFESGFDFGYERGLFAAWLILHKNRDVVIKEEEKYGGFFRKFVASSSVHKLMDLVMHYMNLDECDTNKNYKPIDCYCEKCGKLK